MNFSDDDKKTITRRMLNIELENVGYSTSINTFGKQKELLAKVDASNANLYNNYNSQAENYEDEARAIDGKIPLRYNASDIAESGQTGFNSIFFPNSGTPLYARLIPLIHDGIYTNSAIRGRFATTGNDTDFEKINVSSPTALQGLIETINTFKAGFSYGMSTDTYSGTIPAGNVTNVSLTKATGGTPSVNDWVIAYSGSNGGIYKVTSVTGSPPSITVKVDSLMPSPGAIIGPTLSNSFSGFNNSQRQSLSGGLLQGVLNAFTVYISQRIQDWENKLTTELTKLSNNTDRRQTQLNQIDLAKKDINNALSIINTWQALPDTGINGKYVDSEINVVSTELSDRSTFISNRITQIETALGTNFNDCLSQNGEEFSAVDMTNVYYKRYSWINLRINRSSGSLRRYYMSDEARKSVQNLKNQNDIASNEYFAFFDTKRITFAGEGDLFVTLSNNDNLIPGDIIFVTSDNNPVLQFAVVDLMGTNQVKLDKPIPSSFLQDENLRLFKVK